MTIVGSQTGANEAGDKLYPARMRANGLGWALGIGRLGGIAGPALGGDLLAPGLRPPIIFLSACGFILGAAVATALLRFREERVESLTISWPTIPTSITRGLARPEERRSPTRSGKRPASGFDYTLYSQLTLAGPEVRIRLPPAGSHVRTRVPQDQADRWNAPLVEAPKGRSDEFVEPYFRGAEPDEVAVILKAREPARIMTAIGVLPFTWRLPPIVSPPQTLP